MAELMRVPAVAAGATEAILSEWLVEEGTTIAEGDPVAVIETEKAQVEVVSEASGVVIKMLVAASSEVLIGAPMVLIGSQDELVAGAAQMLAELGFPSDPLDSPAPERREAPDLLPMKTSPAETGDVVARKFVSPIARRMLREAGINPARLVGSGPGGRINRRDVEAEIARRDMPNHGIERVQAGQVAAPQAATPAMGAPVESIEHSRLRRAVAHRLTMSKQTVPHFYVKRTANIDALVALRRQVNTRDTRRISVNDFVLRAVARAYADLPDANVIWTEEAMQRYGTVDIAVAVASKRGLVTPVLRSVERMSVGTISSEVKGAVERANSGTLQQRDLEGGTISVTNLGMYGVDEFSAIINPPHAAILAVGAGKPTAIAVDGEVTVATTMTLVLSVDHRAIDGALAAQWMQALVVALEDPIGLLV